MRQPLRDRLTKLVGDEHIDAANTNDVYEATESDVARKLMVKRFGPQCAGWLMFAHRRQLHTAGAVDFRIPRLSRARLPMWFALAMRYLEDSAGFEVERRDEIRYLTWRVKWKSRGFWRELRARINAPS